MHFVYLRVPVSLNPLSADQFNAAHHAHAAHKQHEDAHTHDRDHAYDLFQKENRDALGILLVQQDRDVEHHREQLEQVYAEHFVAESVYRSQDVEQFDAFADVEAQERKRAVEDQGDGDLALQRAGGIVGV